tara:strand:- start:298 stop:798 length:501 start_codon:yes stop_codon:yes gene_type:complete
MRNYVTNLDFKYNKERLIKDLDTVDYVDFKLNNVKKAQNPFFIHAPGWQICRDIDHIEEVNRISTYFQKLFETKIRTQFFKQMPGCEIPFHTDGRPMCSINILLSENNSPITFEDIGDVYYHCALLNIKKKHKVKSSKTERWLFNLSILDKTYEECIERLPDTLKN